MARSIYKRAYERRRRRKLVRRVTRLLFSLILLWSAGWGWFVASAPSPTDEAPKADGVVVLTGGPGRIEAGVAALEAGRGERLLISGVNPSLTNQTIHNANGISDEMANCCIDLGREALDTHGNALEAMAWADEHQFSSLLIITSDLHIRRAMLELDGITPHVETRAFPIETNWKITASALEYSKYLISLVRINLLS